MFKERQVNLLKIICCGGDDDGLIHLLYRKKKYDYNLRGNMSEAKLLNGVTGERQRSYLIPLAFLTLLFLMWGFITSMNDILIPHFQNVFQLSHLQAMLIQFCFFGAYFIISVIYFFSSIRNGDLISKIGYKKGIILGLLIMYLFYRQLKLRPYNPKNA